MSDLARHIEAMDDIVPLDDGPEEEMSRCPACGDYIDYCSGHGEIGDPDGYAILQAHDDEDHSGCHSRSDCQFENGAP